MLNVLSSPFNMRSMPQNQCQRNKYPDEGLLEFKKYNKWTGL